jgi:putative nucleotidyltransferase with HDIG domain
VPDPPSASVRDLLDAARRAEQAADWAEALRLYDEAMRHLPDDPSADARPAEVMRRIGILHRERGDLELAYDALEAAGAMAQARGDRRLVAAVSNDLGGVELRRGRLDEAEAVYVRTRAAADEVGDVRLAAVVEQNLAILATIRGDTDAALERYGRALDGLLAVGDHRAAAMVLSNVGMAHVDRGDWDAAGAAFDRAFEVGAGSDDPRTTAFVDLNRTELYLKRGDLVRARASLDRAFPVIERMGSRWRLSAAHRLRGVIHREEGDAASSGRHLRHALDLARQAEDRLLEAEACRELALTLLEGGSKREILRHLNRAHRLFSELGARNEIRDLERRLDGLEQTYRRVVREWGESIESVDHYTAGHCERVAEYAGRLAEAVGFRGRDLAWIRMGAFLHDVGKTAVPAQILNKRGPLTAEEWEVMRAHTLAGDRIVAEMDFPWDIRPIVRNHHEHWDGSGYPDGLAGEAIPLTARILCIADCFDALTTERSYRPALPPDRALAEMSADAGRVLDPRLFETFARLQG